MAEPKQIKFNGNKTHQGDCLIFAGKVDGAMMCVHIKLNDHGIQEAEHFSVDEFGQWMGGN